MFINLTPSINKVWDSSHLWEFFPKGFHQIDFKIMNSSGFSSNTKLMPWISLFIIPFGYYEYINMYYNSITLLLDWLVSIVEDDLFPLTLRCDLELNCIILTQFVWLVREILSYVFNMLYMSRLIYIVVQWW